eukprot:Skav213833  [mRNA]  locus=scaffold315:55992:58735:+ [translate_table: standard]
MDLPIAWPLATARTPAAPTRTVAAPCSLASSLALPAVLLLESPLIHGHTGDGLPNMLIDQEEEGAIEAVEPVEPVEDPGDAIDIQQIDRSGQVAVLGVPNSGKSSLVNELVGTKVSIVSPKPQTTRQRILGLALLAPRPGMSPTTQAVFADTAGIMETGQTVSEFGFRHKRKRLFRQNRMHKAMVKTAWKQTKASDAVLWVLDAAKCYMYGDYMPPMPELDGVSIGTPVEDAWWLHPELAEELAFLRKLKRLNMKVSVVLNKMDILREMDVNVEEFTLKMREQITSDLGKTTDGQDILENLWPTSVLKDPSSLAPLTQWLCETLPKQSPIYPLENISDVPARVVASELTREKLFAVLRQEVPYHLTVVNVVWRQEADGRLLLGQKAAMKKRVVVVVTTEGQGRIVTSWLRQITEEAEKEISELVNFGRPVELHFQIHVDPKWSENEEYYEDLQGLLDRSGSLLYR